MVIDIKPLFDKLMKDPDVVPEEGSEKEDLALEMAVQRATQSINNNRALSMAVEKSAIEKLADFSFLKKAPPIEFGDTGGSKKEPDDKDQILPEEDRREQWARAGGKPPEMPFLRWLDTQKTDTTKRSGESQEDYEARRKGVSAAAREAAKPEQSAVKKPDKDVILRETVSGRDYEYRIAPVTDGDFKGYRTELRGINPDGSASDWDNAHMGQSASKKGAITAFAKNYGKGGGGHASTIDRSPLEDAELFHPQLQGHLEDSRKAIAGRKQREGEQKAAEETATKTRQDRIASIDASAKGTKYKKTTLTFKGQLDGEEQTLSGFASKGLMYHKGRYGGYNITHEDSAMVVAGDFNYVSDVKTAIHRLSQLTDWTKMGNSPEEANAFLAGNPRLRSSLGEVIKVLRDDVYGDISKHVPSEEAATPTPSKKAAASKPKTASTGSTDPASPNYKAPNTHVWEGHPVMEGGGGVREGDVGKSIIAVQMTPAVVTRHKAATGRAKDAIRKESQRNAQKHFTDWFKKEFGRIPLSGETPIFSAHEDRGASIANWPWRGVKAADFTETAATPTPEPKTEADTPTPKATPKETDTPKASAVQRLAENVENREAAEENAELEGFSDSEKTEYKKLKAERQTLVDAIIPRVTPKKKLVRPQSADSPARKAIRAFNVDPTKGVREKELDKKLKGLEEASEKARREQRREKDLINEGTTPADGAQLARLKGTAPPNEHTTPEGVEEPTAGTKIHTMADAAQRGEELYDAFVNPVDKDGNSVEWTDEDFTGGKETIPQKVMNKLPNWVSEEQATEVWNDFSSVVYGSMGGSEDLQEEEYPILPIQGKGKKAEQAARKAEQKAREEQREGMGMSVDAEIKDRFSNASDFVEAISGSWESLDFKGDKTPDPVHGFDYDHGLHERRFGTYSRETGARGGRQMGGEWGTLRNQLVEIDTKVREHNEDNPDAQIQPISDLLAEIRANPEEWHKNKGFGSRRITRRDARSSTGFSEQWNFKALEGYILNAPKDPNNLDAGSLYEEFLPMELQSKANDEHMNTRWDGSDVYYEQMRKWETFAVQAFDELEYGRGGKKPLRRVWADHLETAEAQEAMYPEGDPWEDQGGSWEKGRITGGWQPYEGEPFGDTPEKIEAERWRRIRASHEGVHAEFINFMKDEVAGDFTWSDSQEVENPETGKMETKHHSVKGIQDALDKTVEDRSPAEQRAVEAFNHQVDYQLENTNFATRTVPVIDEKTGEPKTFVDDKGETQIVTEKQEYNIKDLPVLTEEGFKLQAGQDRTLADYVETAKTAKKRRGSQRKDRMTSKTPRPERAVGETEETTDDTPSDELPNSLRDAITKVVADEKDHRAVRTKVDKLVDEYLKEHLGDGAAEARDPDVSTTVHLHESDRQQWVDSILKKAAEHMDKEVTKVKKATKDTDSPRFRDVTPISWSKEPRDAEEVINTITGTTPKAREHTSVEGDDDQTKAANKLVEEGIVGNFDDAHKLLGDLTENEIRDMHKNVNAQRPFTTKSVNSAVMKARIHAIKTAREAAEAKDKADASGQDAKPADGAQTDAHRQKLSDAGIDPEGLSHLNTDELIADHIEAKHTQEEADEAKDIADTTIHPDPNAVPEGEEQAKLEGMPEEEKTFKGSHQARKAFMDHYGEKFNARVEDGTLDPPEGQDKWGVGDAREHVADDLKSKETDTEETTEETPVTTTDETTEDKGGPPQGEDPDWDKYQETEPDLTYERYLKDTPEGRAVSDPALRAALDGNNPFRLTDQSNEGHLKSHSADHREAEKAAMEAGWDPLDTSPENMAKANEFLADAHEKSGGKGPAPETPTEEAAPTEEKKPVVTETETSAATETEKPEPVRGVQFGPDVEEPTTGTKPVVSEDTGKKHVEDRNKAAQSAEKDEDDAVTAEMRQYIKDNLKHSIYNSERAVDLIKPAVVHKEFDKTHAKHSVHEGNENDKKQKDKLARKLGALVHGEAWDKEDQEAFVESVDSLTVDDLQSSIKERQRNHLTATTAKYNAEAKEAAAIITQHKKIRANNISALVGDLPPETGRAAATDRYRAIMRHLNEHETGMDKKVLEQLHEAAHVATQAGADVKTVDAEVDKHNQSMLGKKEVGKDAKGVMQYEDTGEESKPYYDTQEDTDAQASHGHKLGEEDAYHDLLAGHGGYEARRHAFENSDSNRFVHHDDEGNVTHTTHQHEDYGDEGSKLGKRFNRVKGRTKEEPEGQARSHHNDDHHVPSRYGDEDGPKKKNATGRKHSPDWQAYAEGEDREEGERSRATALEEHHGEQDQSDAPRDTATGEKSDWEKEQERMARGQAPGPAPRAGLVWAAGIHHWVKPEKLAELQSGLGAGQSLYIPNNKLQGALGHDDTNEDGSLIHDMSANHLAHDGNDSGKRGHQDGVLMTKTGIHGVGKTHQANEDGSLIPPDSLEANSAERHEGSGDSLTGAVLAQALQNHDRNDSHILEHGELAGTGVHSSRTPPEAGLGDTVSSKGRKALEALGIDMSTPLKRFDARRDNPGIINAIKREATGGEYGEMRRKGASRGDVWRQLGSDLRQTARENLSDTKPFHGIPAGLVHSVKDVATGGKSKRQREIHNYIGSELKRKKAQDTQTEAVHDTIQSGLASKKYSAEDIARIYNG